MFSVRYTGCPSVQEVPIKAWALKPGIVAEVEKLWAEAQAEESGKLFDGTVFSVTDVAGPLIRGHFVDYKFFVAVRRRPELFSDMQIQPLALTGVSRCAGGVIIGCRSDRVTQDQGLWEFVPSGGLDPSSRRSDGSIDFVRQLLQELREETGLSSESAPEVFPRCVIEDSSTHVFDIVADLVLDKPFREIENTLRQTLHAEHEEFKILDADEVAAFVEDHWDRVAPLSRYLARELKLLADA